MRYYIYTTIILKGIIVLILAMKLARIYIPIYVGFWFEEKIIWNRRIEKPRLFFYQIGGLMIFFSCWTLYGNSKIDTSSLNFIVTDILSWILFIMGSLICFTSWTNWFKEKVVFQVKNQIKRFNYSDIRCAYKQEKELKLIYTNSTKENLIQADFDSFLKLSNLEPLKDSHKIKWIDENFRRPGNSNRQTLINYVMTLFPNIDSLLTNKKLTAKQVIELIDIYFVDSNNKSLFDHLKSNKAKCITDWKSNESKYLKEKDNVFKIR